MHAEQRLTETREWLKQRERELVKDATAAAPEHPNK
jgi:hypothetical protein